MRSDIFLFGFENVIELIKVSDSRIKEVEISPIIESWVLIVLINTVIRVISLDLIKNEDDLFAQINNIFNDT